MISVEIDMDRGLDSRPAVQSANMYYPASRGGYIGRISHAITSGAFSVYVQEVHSGIMWVTNKIYA
jgi:hypothetical protein